MSIQIVYELADTVDQEITVKDVPIWVENIRPHVYFQGASLAGTLYLQLLDEDGFLIKQSSSSVNLATVKADLAYDEAWHGYYKFDLNFGFSANTTYILRLSAIGGYSFSETDYVGWCSGYFRERFWNNITYTPVTEAAAPLDFEIWVRKQTMPRILDLTDGFDVSAPPSSSVVELVETSFSVANNVAAAADVTGLSFSSAISTGAKVIAEARRKTDSSEVTSIVEIDVRYQESTSDWGIDWAERGDDSGLDFSITAAGQVQYTSDDLTGANYSGTLKFKSITFTA